MTKRKPNRGQIPGTVFKRGNKWAYAFDGPPHPLTGDRQRITKSGFETEDDAWDAMAEAQNAIKTETYVKPSRAKVSDFFERWIPYAHTTTEPTTAANYEQLAKAYVLPWIGKRSMQEIVPSVIVALYQHLLTAGRRKRDTNWEMFQLWEDAQLSKREIRPREVADKVGVSYAAARKAFRRYEVGRVPSPPEAGLSPKTVQSVHIMLSSAMTTAVVWQYIGRNPVTGVKAPSVPRRPHKTWTPAQLRRFLEEARGERLFAMWVLEAATGMRRSELCGLPLDRFAPEEARVRMNATRVVAGGKVQAGSGKSQKSRRSMALDAFTVAVVRIHVAMIEEEKRLWGSTYQDHGLMFCWEDGTPIYPDTITEHFNRIVDRAGLPRIRLHDVRHTYATIALRSGTHPKIVSSRLGHAKVAFTLDTYTEDIPDIDADAAEAIGGLFLPVLKEEDD
ncbi:site-specific integrase [Lentzea tibetensis]|uniref:Site-specific integrase n=1 Tax=Lentzea tibetensis TaxID=2591470 RepID=A0A563EVV1_9PSEU|nr:site-specific integrase [Lentzea tibetensis]TWP51702.1 site-specific integrase [Lentzea tibetensis]